MGLIQQVQMMHTPTSTANQTAPSMIKRSNFLLTPTAPENYQDPEKFKNRMKKYKNGTTIPNLTTQINHLLPTPTATDFKGSGRNTTMRDRLDYQVEKTPDGERLNGQLNPHFVEQMMGFPVGWTDLELLEIL